MDFPATFPNHLKPRVYIAALRARKRFPKRNTHDATERVREGLSAFARATFNAIKEGHWDVDSAYKGFEEFLEALTLEELAWEQGASTFYYPDDLRVVTSQIKDSRRWLNYFQKLAAIAKARASSGRAEGSARTRSIDRKAVVLPILQQKGMSPSKWADKAGVDPSVVYDYLDGKSKPRPENRKALAEAIKLSMADLPE
jgi:helix-turn-helix protein